MRRFFLALVVLLAAGIIVLLWSTDWLASIGGRVEGGTKFRNPVPSQMLKGSTREMLRRQFFGKEQRTPVKPVPIARRSAADFSAPPSSGLRATWMGWSTVLIEIDGRRVLTDPIWSERCSPTTLIGPKRLHDVPIALAELPPIDAVVISHDHYDHLDMETIRTLSSRGAHFVVPTGIGVHLRRWRVPSSQITELGWNASHRVRDLVITATPSRHYSGRLPTRNNSTLWASWVIKGPQHRVFFSGDTGYFDGFKTIGAQHGPFDMTFIKIGAYDTSWNEIHFEPEPAVQTHQDLRGGLMLPIHWATFNLAFHAWTEPPERARLAAEKAGVRLIIPRPGEMVESDVVVRDDPWWR